MLQCVACVAECREKTESCQARFPGPLGQCKSCARRTEDSVHDVHDAHAVHESKSGMVPCVGDTSFRFAKHFLNFFIQIVILKHSMLAFPLVTLVHGMFFWSGTHNECGWSTAVIGPQNRPIMYSSSWLPLPQDGVQVVQVTMKSQSCSNKSRVAGVPSQDFRGTWKRKSVESVLRVLYTFFQLFKVVLVFEPKMKWNSSLFHLKSSKQLISHAEETKKTLSISS